jgi:hypothetical protein
LRGGKLFCGRRDDYNPGRAALSAMSSCLFLNTVMGRFLFGNSSILDD